MRSWDWKGLLLIAVTLHLISSCGEVWCCSRDAPLKEMAVSVMLILWYIVFAYKVYFFFICVKGFDSSAIWAAGSSSEKGHCPLYKACVQV